MPPLRYAVTYESLRDLSAARYENLRDMSVAQYESFRGISSVQMPDSWNDLCVTRLGVHDSCLDAGLQGLIFLYIRMSYPFQYACNNCNHPSFLVFPNPLHP